VTRMAASLALLLLAAPAAAHLPQLRGRLIDLATQSDAIVLATVERSVSAAPQRNETTVRVERWLAGAATDEHVTFTAGPRFAAGQRYVFFLRRDPAGFTCLQPSGTVFASRPQDDRAYSEAIASIRAAGFADGELRAVLLRHAMIAALAAPAPALRFHAVLELAALAQHGVSDSERRAIERLLGDPATDPTIRPALTSLLAASSPPAP